MNIYVVVEGERTEKLVYTSWIKFANAGLSPISRMDAVSQNHYFIENGGGYPYIFQLIDGALETIVSYQPNGYQVFDRLVVVVDSEENTREEKHDEFNDYISDVCARNGWRVDYRIVVQHFCFEAWALGNVSLFRGNIRSARLAKYIRDFNVSTLDPELLPPRADEDKNRAQHAKQYLSLLFDEKFPRKGYSETNPGPLCHESYFKRLRQRLDETSHIQSFQAMLTAFQ